MTLSLPVKRRLTKCFVPGASRIYLFDEGSGTTLTDYSGNAYHGTLGAAGAAPTWETYGLSFDGGDQITIPPLTFANTQGFTISVVFQYTTATTEGVARLLYNVAGAGYPGVSIVTNRSTAGKVDLYVGSYVTNFGTGLNDGAPHLLQAICYGDGSAGVSIDGGAVDLRTGLTQNTSTAAATGYIGSTGAAANYYVGGMSALLIHPFAFSTAQIAQNYAAIEAALAPRGVTLL